MKRERPKSNRTSPPRNSTSMARSSSSTTRSCWGMTGWTSNSAASSACPRPCCTRAMAAKSPPRSVRCWSIPTISPRRSKLNSESRRTRVRKQNMDEQDFRRKSDHALESLKRRLLELGDELGFEVEGQGDKLEVLFEDP